MRASSLGELSTAGRAPMRRHGVRSVIDIRSPEEVVEAPSPYARGATYRNAQFTLGRTMQIDQAAVAGTMPAELARLARPESGLADVIQAIAGAEPGIVLHCLAGRDRTGFVVAILLSALGVGEDDIVSDYAASDGELETEYERYLTGHADDAGDVRGGIARREGTMRAVLATLGAEYGDGATYLRVAGVADPDVERLRAKLLA